MKKPLKRISAGKRINDAAGTIIDVILDSRIEKRGTDARAHKITDETLRLAPRRRLAKKILAALMSELDGEKRTGLKMSAQKLGECAEEHAKQIARAMGLERDKKPIE